MKKKFDKEFALKVIKDGDKLSDSEKNVAVGCIYLWSFVSGKDIVDIDSCFFIEVKEAFDEILETLTERERNVLIKRFSLNGSEEIKSLKEIGDDYQLTPEGVRQIEARALRKLRRKSRGRKIEEILDKKSFYEEKLAELEIKLAEKDNALQQNEAELVQLQKENKDIKINSTIDQLELSVRSYSFLKKAGIDTLERLSQMTCEDLIKIRNMGRKNVEEIISKMSEYGIIIEES